MLRGRRTTPSASPYARPPDRSPAAAQSLSPRWLSGLILGAGKIISSVLPTYRSSESPSVSSVYSSDEEETSSGFSELLILYLFTTCFFSVLIRIQCKSLEKRVFRS